ncbi:MAG TPA: AAA family ATPase [Chryseosolibacter sp.]
MKRGLVIGKFMPPHLGHVALINFAKQQCDELIVSMSYTDQDAIPHTKRLEWLTSIFDGDKKIIVRTLVDDFDNPLLPLAERTKRWAQIISHVYPKIDVVVSSEAYGEPFANHLQAKHISFDEGRRQVPIAASTIRQKPLSNWHFIPQVVKPYFVKKICFYGAESTGKSTMAKIMAGKYNTVFVPEVAREMITSNDFTLDDIITIGHAHFQRIIDATQTANKILFCDTDVLTTQIYSQHYLDTIPPILYELERKMTYDKYFLFDIDVPWVADGLRDLGHQREAMHARFVRELQRRNINFVLVSGTWQEREQLITAEIDKLLRDA